MFRYIVALSLFALGTGFIVAGILTGTMVLFMAGMACFVCAAVAERIGAEHE